MQITNQKKMAAQILKCGVNRVWINPSYLDQVAQSVQKEDIREDDEVTDLGTGKFFVVDEASMMYVAGTKIDWKEEVFGSQFEIINPNAQSGCGCGESFGV